MTYSQKLRSPKWQKKRLEILQRDEFKCCLCGDGEIELHVHHLKYTGEPWQAPNEDLQTLCKICHGVVSRYPEIDFVKAVYFTNESAVFKSYEKALYWYKFNAEKGTVSEFFSFPPESKILKLLYELNNE